MKYVLDAGVAIKWVLPEADSGKAIRLRDEYKNGVHELLSPDLFPSEIANALASAERQGRIKTGESAIFIMTFSVPLPCCFRRRPYSCEQWPWRLDPEGRLRLHLPRSGGSGRMRVGDSR